MKRRNVLTLVLALVLVAALAVGATLAYFTDVDAEKNTFTMGKVDINLDESPDDGKTWDEDGLEYPNVVPNATVKKMARLTVGDNSQNCYLMVTVEVTDAARYDETTKKGFKDTDIDALYTAVTSAIDSTKWDVKKVDGKLQCVYLGTGDHIAKKGEELILFSTITIPDSFGNNTAEQTFKLELKAYAVQSDNLVYSDSIWTDNFKSETTPAPESGTTEPAA